MTLLEPGTRIESHEIVRFVAAGGMCLVYEARSMGDTKSVAIKVLHEMWLSDGEITQRFLNEANVLRSMHHPNIVRLSSAGTMPSGQPYMMLEWLPLHLADLLHARPSGLGPELAVRLSIQLARALVHLHDQNIVHRDIKAANVLLDSQDIATARPRLADLGLAKVAPERRSLAGMNVSTGSGKQFGTWDYMAPEQWIKSKTVDAKADVYSLGILLYQMISGQLPFVAESHNGLMSMHLFEAPPLKRLGSEVFPALRALLGRMLDKLAKKRPTMNDVLQRLEEMAN